MRVTGIEARSIPDSRGRPTVEVATRASFLGRALEATASVPSGKSTGSHEAVELRDADGGVEKAIAHVTGEIAEALATHDFGDPDELDDFLIRLDGTPDKARLGANAILAVSIAAQRLFAQAEGVPLWQAIARRGGFASAPPRLYVNLLNGGAHAHFTMPFQEHLLVCEGAPSVAYATAQEAFARLGQLLETSDFPQGSPALGLQMPRGGSGETPRSVPMGDEGGYAPTFDTLEKPFELLAELARSFSGTTLAIDAAANELRAGSGYELLTRHYTPVQLAQVYENLAARYSLHSIEDPFSEDADSDFSNLTVALEGRCLVVGDDFTATNPLRIKAAAQQRAINAVLIKPNQIGSVKEAIAAVQETRARGWQPICSHRSGETMDAFIADFAYGVGAHGLKAGGLAQKERVAKYERLLEIEKEARGV